MATRGRAPALRHAPALDGLRGVGVVGVLLFHAGHLRGGFLGVDLFFVLSGFLITSLLLVEWRSSGALDLLHFWSRRLRRLLPAALVTLLGTTVFAAIHLEGGALERYRGDALAALANLANWQAIRSDADYWVALAEPSPLRHMWSLAIEAQLYLVWPLVVLGAVRLGRARRRSRDTALLVTAVLYVASVTAMVVLGSGSSTIRAYYGTDTRASAVLVGAMTALIVQRWEPRIGPDPPLRTLRGATAVSVGVLAAAWLWSDGEASWLYRWGFPVFGLAAAVLVAWAALARTGPGHAVVASWPLRRLGAMSYGIYLIHWPVYIGIDQDLGWNRWVLTTVRIVVSVGLAAVSLRYVEEPVRSRRVGPRQWRALGLAGVALVIGSVLLVTNGARPDPGGAGGVIEQEASGPTGAPLVLLIGDSQATALSIGAEAASGTTARQASATLVGCGIGPGLPVAKGVAVERDMDGESCLTAVDRFAAAVDGARADVVLLHVGAWEIFDRLLGEDVVPFETDRWDRETRRNLDIVLARLTAGGQRVVALAAPCFPEGGEAGVEVFGDLARDEGEVRVQDARVHRWNDLLREVAPTVGVEVLPYDTLFCDVDPDGSPERGDGVHLTEDGAEDAWRWILPRLGLDGS